jgi:hypothetical protein
MRKRIQILLLVALGVAAGLTTREVLQVFGEQEPVYHGKRLSAWLEPCRLYGTAGVETWQVRLAEQEAEEAVRHAGTNALPTLLRMLRAHDSALKTAFMCWAERHHFIRTKPTSAEDLNYRACWAFGVLRAKARCAVPALLEAATQGRSPHSRYYALTALTSIGSPAREAIPRLLELATNADSVVRSYATNALNAMARPP